MADEAGSLLREARVRAGLTQTELARRAGVAQSVVSAYESGRREPSLPTLRRLVSATGGRLVLEVRHEGLDVLPRDLVRARRDLLLEIAARHGATNVRLFGSVARGEDDHDSDVDLLVDLPRRTGLFALLALRRELSEALGTSVDVVPSDALKEQVRADAERDAVPL